MLRYIVERFLGRKHLVLEEYTLGVDVFGRAYYQGEGRRDEVRIDVPEGSYVPRIVSTDGSDPRISE